MAVESAEKLAHHGCGASIWKVVAVIQHPLPVNIGELPRLSQEGDVAGTVIQSVKRNAHVVVIPDGGGISVQPRQERESVRIRSRHEISVLSATARLEHVHL